MSRPVPRPRPGQPTPTVLVTVGTDVHPFERLLDWVGRWYRRGPAVHLVVQHGHSPAPALPGAAAFLDHDALRRAMRAATAVVTHGGPATITQARQAGRLPIVVARDPAHGEHVDDHQCRFVRRMAAAGLVRSCAAPAELAAALDDALADPAAGQVAAAPAVPPGVARVGAIVDALIAERARRCR